MHVTPPMPLSLNRKEVLNNDLKQSLSHRFHLGGLQNLFRQSCCHTLALESSPRKKRVIGILNNYQHQFVFALLCNRFINLPCCNDKNIQSVFNPKSFQTIPFAKSSCQIRKETVQLLELVGKIIAWAFRTHGWSTLAGFLLEKSTRTLFQTNLRTNTQRITTHLDLHDYNSCEFIAALHKSTER